MLLWLHINIIWLIHLKERQTLSFIVFIGDLIFWSELRLHPIETSDIPPQDVDLFITILLTDQFSWCDKNLMVFLFLVRIHDGSRSTQTFKWSHRWHHRVGLLTSACGRSFRCSQQRLMSWWCHFKATEANCCPLCLLMFAPFLRHVIYSIIC